MASKTSPSDPRNLDQLVHDLRNPLAVIGNALMILKTEGPQGPHTQWALDMIERQTRDMARLLEGASGGAPAAAPVAPATARRILVVDDNRLAATSLALLLKQAGHELRTAHDGEAALAAAAEFRPDVVVLDIGLPKLDGYAAARRLRELPGGGDLLLIALTGWGQDEDRARAREAGFDHHLVKPVDAGTLSRLLDAPASARKPSM